MEGTKNEYFFPKVCLFLSVCTYLKLNKTIVSTKFLQSDFGAQLFFLFCISVWCIYIPMRCAFSQQWIFRLWSWGVMTPCSGYQDFGTVSPLTIKMEATDFFKPLPLNFQTAWYHIQEHRIFTFTAVRTSNLISIIRYNLSVICLTFPSWPQ